MAGPKTKTAAVQAAGRSVKASTGKRAQDDDSAAGRRHQIMAEAARLFAVRGFDATTIRDIATASGILGGSIYYHFASKEEIFLAVHSAGMETISSAVKAAIEGVRDPWKRLEAAAVAHCEALLATHELPVLVSPYYSESIGSLREALVAQRDSYDRLFAGIINDLPLPAGVSPSIFRLHVLGALNWIPTWYKDGSRYTPAEIGRQLIAMLQHGAPTRPAKGAKLRT